MIRSVIIVLITAWAAISEAGPYRTVVPFAGRVSGGGGSEYYTTLWLTNLEDRSGKVTVSFLERGQANHTPQRVEVTLAAKQTRVFENTMETLFGRREGFGALLITSTTNVATFARLFNLRSGESGGDTEGAATRGVPVEQALTRGDELMLAGAGGDPSEYRYSLFVVEASGRPVTVQVSLMDGGGNAVASRDLYLREHEARTLLMSEFAIKTLDPSATLRLKLRSGDGSVVAAGALTSVRSLDACVFEMVAMPASRIPRSEIVVWISVAVAIAAAAIARIARRAAGSTET